MISLYSEPERPLDPPEHETPDSVIKCDRAILELRDVLRDFDRTPPCLVRQNIVMAINALEEVSDQLQEGNW